ncbi:MAG: DUF6785 family protein [Armatimonadota bacterium]
MAHTDAPAQATTTAQSTPVAVRGMTLRAFVVAIFALLLMGMWIEYEECLNSRGGAFAENAPPNAAVSVILIVLVISALLFYLRRPLRLITAELVVVYCVLLVAAPLMSQGLWHRFFGLIAGIPHEQDFKSYESLPSMLWPHGSNLITEGQFTDGLGRFTYLGSKNKEAQWDTQAQWKGKTWSCPVLDNGDDARGESTLTITLPRRTEQGKEILVPGEYFLFTLLLKAENFSKGSTYSVTAQADNESPNNVLMGTDNTSASLALPYGFERKGMSPFKIPLSLKEKLTFVISMRGAGKLTAHDVQFFNSQAVEGVYTGVKVVRKSNLSTLKDGERDFTLVKPDNMFSPAGLKYLASGFIPLRQWGQTAFAWTLLIGALFMGFFGLNVLMRKQWVDHEHLSFPQNTLPRELFAEETGTDGKPYLSILRNRVMWAGLIFALALALLKGWNFYNPSIPVPLPYYVKAVSLSQEVTHPLLKAFFQGMNLNIWLTFLAIALFVETDILFSMWVTFLLFQLFFLFGKMFNYTSVPGYPWEAQQTIGGFIGYAVLAIYIGRRHLAQVFRHIIGKIRLDEAEEAVSYRKAALMVIGALAILVAWGIWTKAGWQTSLLFFGFILVCGFSASKIRAEAGPFFAYWFPYFSLYFVSALGGFAIFGTTGMLVATICAGFMGTSCFLYMAPVQAEMMDLGRRFKVRAKDIHAGLWLGLLGGLFVGGFILLCWAYGFSANGMNSDYPYSQHWYVKNYFATAELTADRGFADGSLLKEPWDQTSKMNTKGIGIGFVTTLVLGALRSAFTWFPLHPLGYVLSTTYFRGMWFTVLLAWGIRALVQRLGGAHTIRRGLIPFAVGMFLGCMISIIFFDGLSLILRSNGLMDIYNNCWP